MFIDKENTLVVFSFFLYSKAHTFVSGT